MGKITAFQSPMFPFYYSICCTKYYSTVHILLLLTKWQLCNIEQQNFLLKKLNMQLYFFLINDSIYTFIWSIFYKSIVSAEAERLAEELRGTQGGEGVGGEEGEGRGR